VHCLFEPSEAPRFTATFLGRSGCAALVAIEERERTGIGSLKEVHNPIYRTEQPFVQVALS
jgi:hypothetical protein